jgi:Phosphotransferase System HPr (HPr) Family
MAEISRGATIKNMRGLHARASAQLVKTCQEFDAEVTICKDGTAVSGLSIMGLMMLAAGPGSTIMVKAVGNDAEAAVTEICALIENLFGEEA